MDNEEFLIKLVVNDLNKTINKIEGLMDTKITGVKCIYNPNEGNLSKYHYDLNKLNELIISNINNSIVSACMYGKHINRSKLSIKEIKDLSGIIDKKLLILNKCIEDLKD